MAGLTDQGFQIKSFDEIRTDLEEKFKSVFGDDINISSTSLLGQQIGIFTKELYDVWQALLDNYQSRFPDTSYGRGLDQLVSVAGLNRLMGFRSSGVIYLSGSPGTVVPAGTAFSTVLGRVVETTQTVTMIAGQKPSIRITKESGNLATAFNLTVSDDLGGFFENILGNSQNISFTATSEEVKTAMNTLLEGDDLIDSVSVSAQSGIQINFKAAQFLPGLRVNDGSISILQAGLPDGVAVGAVATEEGKIAIQKYEVTEINSPISGLNSVINVNDFILGRLTETDLELRDRWKRRVDAPQTSSGKAIRNAVEEISGVSQAIVFESAGEIEVVVLGGDGRQIANIIHRTKPSGILTRGSQSVLVTDENGNPKAIFFSRPEIKNLFVKVVGTKGIDFPLDGESQIRAALTDYVERFALGGVVRPSPDLIWALAGIEGINSLSITLSEDGSSYSSDNITLLNRESVAFSEIDINIT